MMLIMDEKELTNFPKITWAVLFPDTSFLSPLKDILKQNFPETMEARYTADKGGNKKKAIVRMLIPEKYRRMPNGRDITDTSDSLFGRYFKYENDNFAQNRYNAVKQNILNRAKAGNWDFDSFDFIRELKENVKKIFSYFPEDFRNDYQVDVVHLIGLFEQMPVFKDIKEELLAADFYSQVTSLTAIAATWHCWFSSREDAEELSYFIVPSRKRQIVSRSSSSEWIAKYTTQKKEAAAAKLEDVRSLLKEGQDYNEAGDLCARIIKENLADDAVLGEAYYHLAVCCADHGYTYSGKLSVKELLQKASEYGYLPARERLRQENGEPDPVSLIRPLAETHGTAKIICNTVNEYFDEFLRTIPKEMQKEEIREKMIFPAVVKKKLTGFITPDEDCRFLLFDDSQEKNFQDLLFILNEISSREKNSSENDSAVISLRWSRTTIYIRVSEDKYSALIDTAMKRLGNFTVRVFTIDDNKWAAQSLLYHHPLFRPFEDLDGRRLKNRPVTLNFNIISSGNTDLTFWLIREAFWMGCFHYSGITIAINLISPDAEEIESRLRFDCPGMFASLPDSEYTSKILPLNVQKSVKSVFDTEVIAFLNDRHKDADYNYYVINVGDDIENLNYGIKIREWSIRKLIEDGKKLQSRNLPLIAFYCKNPDVAHLSQHMVVQMTDCGNSWYNNYNLISFGSLRDRYSWDRIDGDYLEKVAESTHLEYCGCSPSDSLVTKTDYLKNYFDRSYNRDSSMAVALSMPYRLFQTDVNGTDHILADIDLEDSAAEGAAALAEKFDSAMADLSRCDELKKNLLLYEHSRWLRWAIARGWKKAVPEEVVRYMKAGNPKQQLYIARLHGCICALQELDELADAMCECADSTSRSDWSRFAAGRRAISLEDYGKKRSSYDSYYIYTPKDFADIDKMNIRDTGKIITTAWIPEKIKEPEAER